MNEKLEKLKKDLLGVRASLTSFEDALLRAGMTLRQLHSGVSFAMGAENQISSNLECGLCALDATLLKAQAFHHELTISLDDLTLRVSSSSSLSEKQIEELWNERKGVLQWKITKVVTCHRDIFKQLAALFDSLKLPDSPNSSHNPPAISRATKPKMIHDDSMLQQQQPQKAQPIHSRSQTLASLPTTTTNASPRRPEKLASPRNNNNKDWENFSTITVPLPCKANSSSNSTQPNSIASEILALSTRFDFIQFYQPQAEVGPTGNGNGGITTNSLDGTKDNSKFNEDDEENISALLTRAAKSLINGIPRGALQSLDFKLAKISPFSPSSSSPFEITNNNPFEISVKLSDGRQPPITILVSCEKSSTLLSVLDSSIIKSGGNFQRSTFSIARIAGTIEVIQDLSVLICDIGYTQKRLSRKRLPCFVFEPKNDVTFRDDSLPYITGSSTPELPVVETRVLPSCNVKRPFQIRVIGIENVSFSIITEQHISIHDTAYNALKQSFVEKKTFEDSQIELYLELKLFHGNAELSKGFMASSHKPTAFWVQWLSSEMLYSDLPRETRIQITLFSKRTTETVKVVPIAITWTKVFSPSGLLERGVKMLRMQTLSHASKKELIKVRNMVLSVEFERTPEPLLFTLPAITQETTNSPNEEEVKKLDYFFSSNSTATEPNEENKALIYKFPQYVLSKFKQEGFIQLIASTSWSDLKTATKILGTVSLWPVLSIDQSIRLLGASCPTKEIRDFAVRCIEMNENDEILGLFLPQLVHSLMAFETLHLSSLAQMLLIRSLKNRVDIGQTFFWLLYIYTSVADTKFRSSFLLSVYIWGCGQRQRQDLIDQLRIVRQLESIALNRLPQTAVTERTTILKQSLKTLSFSKISLPCNSHIRVSSFNIDRCHVSENSPSTLWLSFVNPDSNESFEIVLNSGCIAPIEFANQQLYKIIDWCCCGINAEQTYLSLNGCTATSVSSLMIEVEFGDCLIEQTKKDFGGSLKKFIKVSSGATQGKSVKTLSSSSASYCIASYIIGINSADPDKILINNSGFISHFCFETSKVQSELSFVFPKDLASVISESQEIRALFFDTSSRLFVALRNHSKLLCFLCPQSFASLHLDQTSDDATKRFISDLANAIRKACL